MNLAVSPASSANQAAIEAIIRGHIERAVEVAGGSQPKLAKASGCSQNAIWKAHKLGRVSPQLAVKIERGTAGMVKREQLCPDVFAPAEMGAAA